MGELAHGAMLVGALACAACTIAGPRHGRVVDVAASSVMLAAMVDMSLTHVLPGLAWAAVLVAAGLALGARLRVGRAREVRGIRNHRLSRELHRALAFIVGAWAIAGAAGPGAAASVAHAHAASTGLAFGAAVLAMTAFGGWLVARLARGGRREGLHAAEAASTTLMLAAMALPALVPTLG
jgi:hypothetical protein